MPTGVEGERVERVFEGVEVSVHIADDETTPAGALAGWSTTGVSGHYVRNGFDMERLRGGRPGPRQWSWARSASNGLRVIGPWGGCSTSHFPSAVR